MLRNSSLSHPEVTGFSEEEIILIPLPGITLVEELESQERSGVIQWDVWDKLEVWLSDFYRITGLVMTDMNLRNFIYDGDTGILYGLDFEACAEGNMKESAGLLAAFIRLYNPEHTPMKHKIADHILHRFSDRLGLEPDVLFEEAKKQEALLRLRRMNRQ